MSTPKAIDEPALDWHRVLDADELPEGRVTTVTAGHRSVALLHNPDFSKYAELCGALGIRVTEAGGLDEALTRALAHRGPALVEVMTDPELI